MIKVSPSLLACDFTKIGDEVKRMELAGADMLHLDIMDGIFVPNISFGLPVIASIRKMSDMFFDTHLMIANPIEYVDAFAKAGASLITFHFEANSDVAKTIDKIKSLGLKAAVSIKPKTSADVLMPYLNDLDMVLIMTVEPGFGGQKFMADQISKIEQIRAASPDIDIQVDGGIDVNTAPLVTKAGANILVAGSALFSAADYGQAIAELKNACN